MKNVYTFGMMTVLVATMYLASPFLNAQSPLAPVTDAANPIVNDAGIAAGPYTGCAWVDYDNDGDDDLFWGGNFLYRNDGKGVFTAISTSSLGMAIETDANGFGWAGSSWADYDNDGFVDVFITGRQSFLYHNNGNGTFSRITTGSIGEGKSNVAWACAWADFDNDGFVDLVTAAPNGVDFGGGTNRLFHNNGNSTFTRMDTSIVSRLSAPFTTAMWSDFDGDGDMDLFYGSGPANGSLGPDFAFKNMLKETGKAYFERLLNFTPLDEERDGQVWSWVDFDNDGDLDLYITNYGAQAPGLANPLYRNDGGGRFTKITNAGAITTDLGISLGSVWGDVDNDGDLDCIVTNDGGQTARSYYYANNGNGTFSGTTLTSRGTRIGCSLADFNGDGALDAFMVGYTRTNKTLYQNTNTNGNAWVTIRCVGVRSNRSAIGAKVRIKATIAGKAVWQMREISAQNSFQGQSSLTAHFGVAGASMLDSVIVEWTSGAKEILTNIATKKAITITEGRGLTTSVESGNSRGYAPEILRQNAPNPFSATTTIGYVVSTSDWVRLAVYDVLGNEIAVLVDELKAAGEYSSVFQHSGASGTLFARVRVGAVTQVRAILAVQP